MNSYLKPLDNKGWSKHYNMDILNGVVHGIMSNDVSVWSEELINITKVGEKILEIGCGSGMSSLWLAKHNRRVTALDYTESAIELIRSASEKLGITRIDTILADATGRLPFEKNEFDMAFQSGLLEHFSSEEQINLLHNWKYYCHRMVSMIPNAASIPYRVGKQIQESNGTWKYGLEIPKHSMAMEFEAAGIRVEREYTIGTEWALKFLPPMHYIHTYFAKMLEEGIDLDDIMQGYLLVTIGVCEK